MTIDWNLHLQYTMNLIGFQLLVLFLSLLTSSMAICSFLSNNLALSTKPCLVFPKLLGPLEVIVSRPTFLIFILASAGTSSSSSLLSLLKTEDTAALGGFVTGFAVLFERDSLIPNCLLPLSGSAVGLISEADFDDGGGLGEGE